MPFGEPAVVAAASSNWPSSRIGGTSRLAPQATSKRAAGLPRTDAVSPATATRKQIISSHKSSKNPFAIPQARWTARTDRAGCVYRTSIGASGIGRGRPASASRFASFSARRRSVFAEMPFRTEPPNHDWPTRAAKCHRRSTGPSRSCSRSADRRGIRRRDRSRRSAQAFPGKLWARPLDRFFRGEFPLARGVDPARRHDVHADPVLDQLDRGGPSHLVHRRLRHIVSHRPRGGDVGLRRTDQDDRAPLADA